MWKTVGKSDVVLALFVIAITAMLLVPLPPPLLDVLLVINLSFAFLLLLTALYIPNALALLSFPSLLLLTTLFRLGLNIASTRLILSRAEAGEVIRTFGTLLIGSEIVVGVIIFTILTVVNFIVVAKGASRVSEVAARFALDALPGKQMAIEADVRAGILTPEGAQAKREELRKESQLYGAMDGAMKFVQGDVIAGIIIIFANIIGGLYVGIVNHGMALTDAAQTYTTLTVGDGLVHQIPALLISICAGIVVTRVSSGENTTLGGDVGTQLFTRPGTLIFSGALLAILGPLSGLPLPPFVIVGGSLCFGGWYLTRFSVRFPQTAHRRGELASPGRGPLLPGPQQEEERGDEEELIIRLDAALLFKLYKVNAPRYTTWWQEVQRDFFEETGLSLPRVSVVPGDSLISSGYTIELGRTTIEQGTLLLDSVLVEVNPEAANIYGLEVVQETYHPLDGTRVFWSTHSPALRRITEAGGVRVRDFFEYVGLKIVRFYLDKPEELLGVAEIHAQLKQVEKKHPGLLQDAFGKGGLNVALLTELVQRSVRSGISLRDFRGVLERIATYCSANRITLDARETLDFEDIISFIRAARSRQITGLWLSHRRTLKVVTMSGDLARIVDELECSDEGTDHFIDESQLPVLLQSFEPQFEALRAKGIPPFVLICRRNQRAKLQRIFEHWSRTMGILADDEVERGVLREPLGEWRVV